MDIENKEKFQRQFRERFLLRHHMAIILLGTAFSGVLVSKLLFTLHIENLIVRYALAIALSYLIFFVCIKLWLFYVSPKRRLKLDATDFLDIPTPSGGPAAESISGIHGGGGEFFGAGASGSFDAHSSIITEMPASTIADGVSSGVGEVVSGAADAAGDEGGIIGIIVLAVLAALVATILGGAIYIIIEAPAILSEAAFEGLLAATLVKRTRLIDNEDWIGSVFKATWIPFAATLGVATLCAAFLHSRFPEAHRLLDIIKGG